MEAAPPKRQRTGDCEPPPPGCLMMGTGEYTTGYVGGTASKSDKSTGVVALVCLDLKQRGKLGRLGMCGTNGTKLPGVREHMQRVLGDVYEGIDPKQIETFPADDVVDRQAFKAASESFKPGDCAIIFTPDDTHFEIAMTCIKRGMHVLITKPPVKTLEEHRQLLAAAAENNVLVQIEVHKRFDPIYAGLGPFSYFTSYMSQPKHQLETFKAWAGKSSDISYYLNSHHVDFHVWTQANKKLAPVKTEDTITLAVTWLNLSDGSTGHALYTSSWIAPKADVHSQQRWFYMGQDGEVNVDQAHRGYTMATDEVQATGSHFGNVNPLFWKPTPTNGKFTAQRCYGYISFESFIEAAHEINCGKKAPTDFDHQLPTIGTTAATTAILEAGKRSLDAGGAPMMLTYASADSAVPTGIEAA